MKYLKFILIWVTCGFLELLPIGYFIGGHAWQTIPAYGIVYGLVGGIQFCVFYKLNHTFGLKFPLTLVGMIAGGVFSILILQTQNSNLIFLILPLAYGLLNGFICEYIINRNRNSTQT